MPQIFEIEKARHQLIEELIRFNQMPASDKDRRKVISLKKLLTTATSTEVEKQYQRIAWLSVKIEEYIELTGINYRIRHKHIMGKIFELAISLAIIAIRTDKLSHAHMLSILLSNLHNSLDICGKDQTTISDAIILLEQSPRSTLDNPNILREINDLMLITTVYVRMKNPADQQDVCNSVIDATKELINHLRALN